MAKVREGLVATGVSGRAGNAVFVQTSGGTVLRDRPRINDPRTAAQRAQRNRMAVVGRAWRALSLAEAVRWREYAQAQADPVSGKPLSAQLLFSRLGVRYLAVSPDGTPPSLPPANEFPGDAVRFTLGSSGLSLHEVAPAQAKTDQDVASTETLRARTHAKTGAETATPPFDTHDTDEDGVAEDETVRARTHAKSEAETATPQRVVPREERAMATARAKSNGAGVVLLTASRANAPGVVTEVLLQKLPSVHTRTYLEKYRSAGFFAFEQGQTRAIPVPPGIYAVATRFIYAPTGEATNLIEQGIVG